MERIAGFIFVILVVSCVDTIIGHDCGNNACSNHADCNGNKRCCNGHCCKCPCRIKPHQCLEVENGWACNCTGSGFHGQHCECPDPLCDDIYGMIKNCSDFENDFVTLNRTRYSEHGATASGARILYGVASLVDCINHPSALQCHYVTHVGNKCYIYQSQAAFRGGLFQNNIDAHTSAVRVCKVCD
ncbi:uncharacterized protein LOC123532647 [Mercenaria mercenaria]|uniref:uncharacterized protein LOC123532647 n=1 Tax=Mercenaria mercenaria TaxID=6596 RepID=UPI00234F69F5|nr:uncharacterized protein LOC123532647 [Mercenaria mercenaria]